MADFKLANEIEQKINKQDLAQVKQCGADMYEATDGKISIASTERKAIGATSPALLEQEKEKQAQR